MNKRMENIILSKIYKFIENHFNLIMRLTPVFIFVVKNTYIMKIKFIEKKLKGLI